MNEKRIIGYTHDIDLEEWEAIGAGGQQTLRDRLLKRAEESIRDSHLQLEGVPRVEEFDTPAGIEPHTRMVHRFRVSQIGVKDE